MKESKLRIAQVGVANFGSYRRDVMRETGLFELVAAYDINPAALEECYARDGARPAASYEELLETPGIEAVVVATGLTTFARIPRKASVASDGFDPSTMVGQRRALIPGRAPPPDPILERIGLEVVDADRGVVDPEGP